ncbi:MAG: MOSC domain-containing protein [Anaerolineae bacterium]|nr:MOSC domain-containing protein [Anaerolineae bacterium]
MPDTPLLISLQVGLPRKVTDTGFTGKASTWESGIFKTPVTGAIWLGETHLAGDGQADLSVHGGPDKAVLAYSADHYPFWQTRLPDIQYGAFGENFTIAGLTEDTVCINDVYAIGEARVQVSQPRQPCWKLARKLQSRDLPAHVIETGFSGWYFRVLMEGHVEAGQPIELVERSLSDWTITRVNREIIYAR